MILRLTFAARIALIMRDGLGMAWISAIALYYIARANRRKPCPRLSPGHVAALVELIERTLGRREAVVLRAASSDIFAFELKRPRRSGQRRRRILPRLNQRAIDRHRPARRPLGRRAISRPPASRGRLFSRLVPELTDIAGRPQDRELLAVEMPATLLLGPLGMPVGFGAGIFGSLIALLRCW